MWLRIKALFTSVSTWWHSFDTMVDEEALSQMRWEARQQRERREMEEQAKHEEEQAERIAQHVVRLLGKE